MVEVERNVLFVYDSDTSNRVAKILERMVRNDYPGVRPEMVASRAEALRMLELKRYDAVYIADTMLEDYLIDQGLGRAPEDMYEGLERDCGGFYTGSRERDYCAACRQIVRAARDQGIPVVVGDSEPSFFNDILIDFEGARTLSADYDAPVLHYEAIMSALRE